MRFDLPTGTVTFLFTDVEGSTGLLRELGAEAYADALADHRRVVREACAAKCGVEVDTQGDAFFVAFPSAPGAAAAAQAITDALAPGQICLRIGLHTGTPLVTDEGYVGDDVHFAARVAASGHGGQILLSKSARELIDGLSVTDLGEHRLKDIEGAVSIYQLGDATFPPLKTISNTNLPRPASSFIGREQERDEVVRELRDGARLLTLTGPGGSGKTRLALEAAAELVPAYTAGVFWVGLASLREPSLVTETIAQTLGARDGLAKHVGDREMLLLLDNLEQVIEAAPELSGLVQSCPNLALLVTSRELLRVRGEVEYAVPPLASSEAISLFCERSRLEATDEIAELCSRLDDLPLAVELAAARTKALSPSQILERLSQRLDLLKGGRDADARQQTLRATIAWSYDLLSEEEQRLFRALSVFAGGCRLDAAEAVAAADLDTLQPLVEKSLLRFSSERYWMLETIREFARERLAASRDVDAIGPRHAEWFLALAEQAEPFLKGAEQASWLQRMEDEHDNFRSSLDWFFDHGDVDGEVRLAGTLWMFWYMRGHVTEARRRMRRALDVAPDEPSGARANLLFGTGYLACEQYENEEGLALLEASFACAKEVGATVTAATASSVISIMRAETTSSTADRRAAAAVGEEAVALARGAGDDFVLAIALNNLGGVMATLGENERAAACFEESLEVRRRIGDLSRIALSLANVARMALQEGETTKAATMFAEAAEIATTIGDKRHIHFALAGLGQVAYREERWEVAGTHTRESLRLAQELGMKLPAVEAILGLAGIATATGNTARAMRLAAAGAVHLLPLAPDGAAQVDYHEVIECVKAGCNPETWERAAAKARAMSLDEAIAFALSLTDSPKTPGQEAPPR